jgi:uridine kinase
MDHVYTIGITGGSASGKTTLARALAVCLPEYDPVHINQDYYFRSWEEYSAEERERVRTANRAEAVQWEGFMEAVHKLRAGETVQEPAPGTWRHHRGYDPVTLGPTKLLILEGLFVLYPEELRQLLDLAIYVEVDDSERILRRLSRNVNRENADFARAVAWLRRDVLPNFPVYTESTKQYADLIVPNLRPDSRAVQVLAQGVRSILEQGGARPFTLVEWEEGDPVPRSPWWQSQGWRR